MYDIRCPNKHPKVSIIVPVYNAAPCLRRCIDSILKQTLSDIEVICINDGSTDNSLEILKEYENIDRRIVLINQENKGCASARNIGMQQARALFIGFVDSDDFVDLKMFECLYNAMLQNDVDMVHCDACVLYDYSAVQVGWPDVEGWITRKTGIVENKSLQVIDGMLWNKLFKSDIIKQYQITFPEGMCTIDDNYLTWCYLAVTRNVYFLEKKLYYYIIRCNSVSGKTWERKINNRNKEYFDLVFNLYNFLISNNVFYDYRYAFWDRFCESINLFLHVTKVEDIQLGVLMAKNFLRDKDISYLNESRYNIINSFVNRQPEPAQGHIQVSLAPSRTIINYFRKLMKFILPYGFDHNYQKRRLK
jgi:glycosyltransferase involved in cell wall biosynthesis